MLDAQAVLRSSAVLNEDLGTDSVVVLRSCLMVLLRSAELVLHVLRSNYRGTASLFGVGVRLRSRR